MPLLDASAAVALPDEGFTEEDVIMQLASQTVNVNGEMRSVEDAEELAYKLLASLPRSRLATIQRRIAPLLQFDVVGYLPTEIAMQIFEYLSFENLLVCGLVSRRWQALANDQTLWKSLCQARGWTWKHIPRSYAFATALPQADQWIDSDDDEGMGDSDEDEQGEGQDAEDGLEAAKAELTMMQVELDSGIASMSTLTSISPSFGIPTPTYGAWASSRRERHSAPSILRSLTEASVVRPDYKLLHQTHIKLRNRILSSSYKRTYLQTRGSTHVHAHTNTIYCLQLYTYPDTGRQVLFTGSRDKTVREWNLSTSQVERVITDVHNSSVLSICAHNGYLASAGSDRQVGIWDLATNKLVKILADHDDSVLCVRFDDRRLVSCSKDRTVRVYSFPDLEFQFVLGAHRAAVNAVSISESFIVSASGDRSVRLWDAETGKLLRTFENHHTRGIASIDFAPPIILSGSSDKHIRLFDITTLQGWSTSPEYDGTVPTNNALITPFPLSSAGSSSSSNDNNPTLICQACGSHSIESISIHQADRRSTVRCVHADLVRTVALGEDFVISGSYDLSIKVWDRKTGVLIADLTGGHNGRIFCIGFDSKKIVSCGEDQGICVWDFSHGIDTSFLP